MSSTGEKAPFLHDAASVSVSVKPSEKPTPAEALFHPLALSTERQVQDWPFLLLALVLSLGWLVFASRQAGFLAPQILPALLLLPSVILAAILGAAAFALFLWLSSQVKQGFVLVCLWVLLVLAVLELLSLALSIVLVHVISAATQQGLKDESQGQGSPPLPPLPPFLTVPVVQLVESVALFLHSAIMLPCLVWIVAASWMILREDLHGKAAAIINKTATFFLIKGRKVLLLVLAGLVLGAILMLPVVLRLLVDVEACKQVGLEDFNTTTSPWHRGRGTLEVSFADHVFSLPSLFLHPVPRSLAVAGLGHATYAAVAASPVAHARALYEFAQSSGVNQTSPTGSQHNASSAMLPPMLPPTFPPLLSPECEAHVFEWMPGSPSSVMFAILGFFLLSWASRVLSSAFVFISSFYIAEDHAASASASPSSTPLARTLTLSFWHSLGTFTFAAFLMDVLALAVLCVAGVPALLGVPSLALAFLLLGFFSLAIFQLIYYRLVIPLVAIHGCSLLQAVFKSFRLLVTFPQEVLSLHFAAYPVGVVLLFVCAIALSMAESGPVALLSLMYGEYLGDAAGVVAGFGASHVLDCFSPIWMASLFASLVTSFYCPSPGHQLLEQDVEPNSAKASDK